MFGDIEGKLSASRRTTNGSERRNHFDKPFRAPSRRTSTKEKKPKYLIEDSAQSIFAHDNGKYLTGDIACFRSTCINILQAGEGGICVTNNETLAKS
jgi:hypothetical protein